jgi:hypothetical protein
MGPASGGPAGAGRAAAGRVRLVLAGVVHRDPEAAPRLWTLLESLRPQGVSVELSRYSLRYRQTHGRRLQTTLERGLDRLEREFAAQTGRRKGAVSPGEHGEVQSIRRAIAVPGEYEVASTYCRRHGARLRLIDLSRVSRRLLPGLDELVSLHNLRLVVAGPHEDPSERMRRERDRVRRLVAGGRPDTGGWPCGVDADPDASVRERHMEWQIRRELRDPAITCWVHIGGWEHLLPAGELRTLGARLADLRPERLVV